MRRLLAALGLLCVAGCGEPPVAAHYSAYPQCPGSGPVQRVGQLEDPALDEASGLVASRANPGLWWSHNDSLNRAVLFALDESGQTRARIDLGIDAIDWEDIAIGPGEGGSWLYLADTGNNLLWRRHPVIYRLREPVLPVVAPPAVERFELRYPDGRHDAEALVVDPRSGDLYLLTKEFDYLARRGLPARVYRLPRPLVDGGTLEFVAEIDFPAMLPLLARPQDEGLLAMDMGSLVTAADISPAGDAIAILTYKGAWLWRIGEGESLAQALEHAPCSLPVTLGGQSEAIGFSVDGHDYVTTSEGLHAVLYKAPLQQPLHSRK